MKMVFSNLGIQCVKKRDIEDALKVREEIRVDPFRSERQTGLCFGSTQLIDSFYV
jgi:Rel homology DNA-binding domain